MSNRCLLVADVSYIIGSNIAMIGCTMPRVNKIDPSQPCRHHSEKFQDLIRPYQQQIF